MLHCVDHIKRVDELLDGVMSVDADLPHGQNPIDLSETAKVPDPDVSLLTQQPRKFDHNILPQNPVAVGAVKVSTRHTPLGDVPFLVEVLHLLREDSLEGLLTVIDKAYEVKTQ